MIVACSSFVVPALLRLVMAAALITLVTIPVVVIAVSSLYAPATRILIAIASPRAAVAIVLAADILITGSLVTNLLVPGSLICLLPVLGNC